MTLSYQNTFGDRLAFAAYHLPRNPLILVLSAGFFLFITFSSTVPALKESLFRHSVVASVLAFILVELLLATGMVAFWAVITVLTMISRRNKPLFCRKTISLGEEGFIGQSEYGRSEIRWAMVQKLTRTRRYIFIYLAQENAVVLPRRAFESVEKWNAFYEFCSQRTDSAHGRK